MFMVTKVYLSGQASGDSASGGCDTEPERILDFFRAADNTMRDLAVYNSRLGFTVTAFISHDDAQTGIITTPWCMAILRIAETPSLRADGETVRHSYPSGEYDFITGTLEGVGAVETCSLFSPMSDFSDMQTVQQAAEAALTGIFTVPNTKAESSPEKSDAIASRALSRRVLLFGRRSA